MEKKGFHLNAEGQLTEGSIWDSSRKRFAFAHAFLTVVLIHYIVILEFGIDKIIYRNENDFRVLYSTSKSIPILEYFNLFKEYT